jgi:hypothetical protein
MGSCVAGRFSVDAAVAGTEVSDAEAAAGKVSLGITVTGRAGIAVEVIGAQAARKTASRLVLSRVDTFTVWLRPRNRRLFLILI